jgi:copper chaperone NosL
VNIQTLTRQLTGLAMLAALGACSQAPHKAHPLEPTDDTVCVLDGMALKDAAGPKAQIHYTEGKPDFLCDLNELFDVVRAPESKRTVAAVFVQDMGKADWDHPQGHWIDAKTATYVAGSGKPGSMGPTFGAFASASDAEAFAAREGGKVLRFDQVTAAMMHGATGNATAAHDDMMH